MFLTRHQGHHGHQDHQDHQGHQGQQGQLKRSDLPMFGNTKVKKEKYKSEKEKYKSVTV